MTAMLNIKDLRAYYGQVQALHGLSFSLNEGSLTTLLGANGAGKTTTLRAICNMVRSTGAIEFEGKPLSGRSTENVVRLGIAHVPQGRGTFTTMTVEENLQLGAITRNDKKAVVADIERMYQHFPVLKERHNQQAGTLSGADRARAVQDPRQDQPRGQGHHSGGGAERATGAGARGQGLRY